jgi:hypothetical protein
LYQRRKSRKGDLQTPNAFGVENRRSLDSAVIDRRYNCFANPVRADVMTDGRKIAGAAQRRTRRGLLQQRSIQGIELENGLAERPFIGSGAGMVGAVHQPSLGYGLAGPNRPDD